MDDIIETLYKWRNQELSDYGIIAELATIADKQGSEFLIRYIVDALIKAMLQTN